MVTNQANAPMNLLGVSMAPILVLATNAVRKVIFPATAAKVRVTLTRCSMVEEATVNHTTVGTAVMVAMMHNMVFMMQLL
jgi:hypothetical protein